MCCLEHLELYLIDPDGWCHGVQSMKAPTSYLCKLVLTLFSVPFQCKELSIN